MCILRDRSSLAAVSARLTRLDVVVRLLYLDLRVPKSRMNRLNLWMAVATLASFSGGCAANNGVTKKQNVPAQERPVAKDATREELLDKYNAFASSTMR
jgi:hypothetical protein